MNDSHALANTPSWSVGMVLVRPSRALQAETFSQEFIAGLDASISRAAGKFLVKVVPDEASERETYEHWAASGSIRSVVIEEFTVSDTRRTLLEDLNLEVTVVGDIEVAGAGPAIWTDHAGAVRLAVESLRSLGHGVIARVSGPKHFRHSIARSEAFFKIGAELDVDVAEAFGDYSRQSGVMATRELLATNEAITAILYDNDLMALGGLAEIEAHGMRVPNDISIVAWDDSVRCQMSMPPLAALSHDVREIGEIAGEAAAQARNGTIMRAETPPPVFVLRQSTGPRTERSAA